VFARSTAYTNAPQCYTYIAYLVYIFFQGFTYVILPVLVAAWCKAYVCGRSPAKTVGSNPTGGTDVCLL